MTKRKPVNTPIRKFSDGDFVRFRFGSLEIEGTIPSTQVPFPLVVVQAPQPEDRLLVSMEQIIEHVPDQDLPP